MWKNVSRETLLNIQNIYSLNFNLIPIYANKFVEKNLINLLNKRKRAQNRTNI